MSGSDPNGWRFLGPTTDGPDPDPEYPQFSIALAYVEHGATIGRSEFPFVKWGYYWSIPGVEGDECDSFAEILRLHSNVRVLKPGAHEWIAVSV